MSEFYTTNAVKVDPRFRAGVARFAANRPALRNYRQLPSIDLRESEIHRVEAIATSVEMIPVVGYFVSVPRLLGAVLLSIGFGIAQGVNQLRQRNATSERERQEALEAERFCEQQAKRAAWNIGRGLANSLPVGGEVFAIHHRDAIHFERQQSHTCWCLRQAIKCVDWLEYTQQAVLAHLPPLVDDFAQKVSAAIASRAELVEQLEMWRSASYNGDGKSADGKIIPRFYRDRKRTVETKAAEVGSQIVELAQRLDRGLAAIPSAKVPVSGQGV